MQLFARVEAGRAADRQWPEADALYPGDGKPEGPAAAGGVQHQSQDRGAAAHRRFQRDGAVDAGCSCIFPRTHYPRVEIQILDGNYDEIRDWIIHGPGGLRLLSSIVEDELQFYPLLR